MQHNREDGRHLGMLQNPVQGDRRAQDGKGRAGQRRAVAILSAKAESGGPLPRADLARNASKSSGLLGMDSLSVALEDLEETARTFREKSRPLLDNGDGKLMESGLLSETGTVVDDEERARTKRKKLMRRSRGQRG